MSGLIDDDRHFLFDCPAMQCILHLVMALCTLKYYNNNTCSGAGQQPQLPAEVLDILHYYRKVSMFSTEHLLSVAHTMSKRMTIDACDRTYT